MPNINLDRSKGDTSVLLSFDATDQSGFDDAYFRFSRINEDGYYDRNNDESVWISRWNSLVSGGSKYDGSYVGLLSISPELEEGKYELSSFQISDSANNSKFFYANTSTNNDVVTRTWSEEAQEALGGINLSTLSFTISGSKSTKI